MTGGPQATFVVEYPCDRFCRIEVELTGERSQITLQQLWEKADGIHRRVHEPGLAELGAPVVVDQEALRRPAATVFRSAPGRGVDRRR
ncbi:hypothetical protein ACIA5D_33345 [Actinoplanes sp. NPDC051513]|uniref:hypothetical protein n=1 Tax=Actinoplanes sp. NPDC051513 TaxID=3363908 RepID=UPI0037AF0274